jgi:uracil-DNA glycosylase
MKDKSAQLQKLMESVYLFEDFIRTGYRNDHPVLRIIPRQSTGNQISPEDTGVKEKEEGSREKQSILLSDKIHQCTQCYLHYNRKHALAGSGVFDPVIFIINSKPGEEDDRANKSFAGPPGDYLQKWLKAIEYSVDDHCFTAHLVRCRPPNNREPREDEIKTCFPFIQKQLLLLQPRVILCLGEIAAQVLTGKTGMSLDALRGKEYFYQQIPLVVTYDPDSVLQNQELRKPVWEDLKYLKQRVEKRTR